MERLIFTIFFCSCVCSMFTMSSATLDADCTSNAAVCTVTNSECGTGNKCACKAGYAANAAKDTCAAVCDTTVCQNEGKCSAPNTCDCTGIGYTGTKCETPILGSTCSVSNANTVCTVPNSECKELKCACKDGYTAKSGLCEDQKNSASTTGKTSNLVIVFFMITILQKVL